MFKNFSSENQLRTGAILSYVVLFLNTIVGLVYTPFMLRKLGQSEFGLYSLVASIIAYLTIFDLGFGNAIVRFTAKLRSEKKFAEQYSMFGMFLILYTFIGILTCIIGLLFFQNIDSLFGESMTSIELNKARVLLMILVFNLAFTFPFSVFTAIITAYEKFIFLKLLQIIRIILNTITLFVILEIGYKAIGLVVVSTFFNIATLIINFLYCKYKIKIKIYFNNFNFSFLKEISIYSFYIFLNVLMDKIYWSTGQFMIGSLVGTAAVAVFAIAIQLQQMYMSFSTSITGVLLPKVTAMVSNNSSRKEISNLFIKIGRFQYIIISFILTSFILFGKYFIIIWAGKDYEKAYLISLLFFIPLTVPLIQNLGIIILQARNEMKFRSIMYICIACVSLILQIPLIKLYGITGSAIAIALALLFGQIIIMNIYYFKKQSIDIPKFWFAILKMSISPSILGIISFFIIKAHRPDTITKLSFSILLFTIVYFIFFWFLSMNKYERETLSKPILKYFVK